MHLRKTRLLLLWLLCLSAGVLSTVAFAQAIPHRSFHRVSFSNGHAVASYNAETSRIDTFLEHPYRFLEPANPDAADLCFSAIESRDLLFDAYFGVRSSDGNSVTNEWLAELPLPSEESAQPALLRGTGILQTAQLARTDELIVRTFSFFPMELPSPTLVQMLEITNNSSTSLDVTPFSLMNAHLGDAYGGREPTADNEQVVFDAARQAFYEFSDDSEGTMAYVALSGVAHATASLGAAGGYATLVSGADLDDNKTTSGAVADVTPAFQGQTLTLAPGEQGSFAVAMVWALDEDAAPDVDALLAFWTSRGGTAASVLQAEGTDWSDWQTPAPIGVDLEFWQNANATLRMGQVREAGPGRGQILASLPPGNGDINAQWNISWVRDMAYATAGLARAGHLDEALEALLFQLRAPRGRHETEVGMPYRISITRYFGNGDEESDCNEDGPNIEFDGFGLFLWSMGEYLRAGGDPEMLRPFWPVIDEEIGDVLLSLREPNGLLKADSSIWEVHSQGKQRHFAYTSLAGARGLCDLADLADVLGHDVEATQYSLAGADLRDAIVELLTDSEGVLAQSTEDLLAGTQYADAATVEAINWGIVHPDGAVANATLDFLFDELRVPTGIGIMRNDDGGDYDSQEWVFVDLRLAAALQAAGDDGRASLLLQWVQAQTRANSFQFAELFDRETADYRGSTPMVGFGPGAWILTTKGGAAPAACGDFSERLDLAVDSGTVLNDAGSAFVDAGIGRDAGRGSDAGLFLDAGSVLPDAAVGLQDAGADAGRKGDAGLAFDAGSQADAGRLEERDAGVDFQDGGTGDFEPDAEPDVVQSECGCSAASSQQPMASWAFLVLLGILASIRRFKK